jgi:hypothetical protein
VVALRKLAAVRGLVNDGLRVRAWPLLLGVHDQPHDAQHYAAAHAAPHKDAAVVACDLDRSLWALTPGWTDAARAESRAALGRVLNAAVAGNAGGVHYFQGLHDVAGVLLLVAGEAAAARLLARLVACHLRDCARPTIQAAVETLGLLYPILRAADPALHAFLASLARESPALETPLFALSWYMTWFAHDVPSLPQCARLFDLFISSHPLMPLYVAAVAMRAGREAVLAGGAGGGEEAYAALKHMRFLQPGQPAADELAAQAAALFQELPPAALARRHAAGMREATTLHAHLRDGRWQVPEAPPPPPLLSSPRLRGRLSGKARGAALAALAAALAAGAGTALVGAALLLIQLDVLQLRHPYS